MNNIIKSLDLQNSKLPDILRQNNPISNNGIFEIKDNSFVEKSVHMEECGAYASVRYTFHNQDNHDFILANIYNSHKQNPSDNEKILQHIIKINPNDVEQIQLPIRNDFFGYTLTRTASKPESSNVFVHASLTKYDQFDNDLPINKFIQEYHNSTLSTNTNDFTLSASLNMFDYVSNKTVTGISDALANGFGQANWDLSVNWGGRNASSNVAVSVNSTDAGDTMDFFVTGYDREENLLNETVTLNGTSDVILTNQYMRITEMVQSGVTNTINGGTIKAFFNDGITDHVLAVVGIQHGRSNMAYYLCPPGKRAIIKRLEVFCSLHNNDIIVRLIKYNDYKDTSPPYVIKEFFLTDVVDYTMGRDLNYLLTNNEEVIITIEPTSSVSGDNHVSCQLEIYEFEDFLN